MIESYVTHESLLAIEPVIDDFVRADELNTQNVIDKCLTDYIPAEVKKRGRDVRKCCVRLALQSSVTKTTEFTGAQSSVDNVERMRLVVKITAVTGSPVFTLDGVNTTTGTYTENIANVTASEAGTYTAIFAEPYLYYRLRLAGTFTTVTYSSYLVERSFDAALEFMALNRIFNRLQNRDGDFKDKAILYKDMYTQELDNIKYYYDEDDSGDITDEEDKSFSQITFGR